MNSRYTYNQFRYDRSTGVHDWSDAGATYRMILLDPDYVFDQTHHDVSDISAHEVTGTGYTGGFGGSGRHAITTRTVYQDDTNNRTILRADSLSWSGIDVGPVGGAAVFFEPAGASADGDCHLCFYYGLDNPDTSGGKTLDLTVDATEGMHQSL